MGTLAELSSDRLVPPRPSEVHLWRASLDLDEETAGVLVASLSAAEVERAQRRPREADRRRFAAGRGWLRILLAGYLDVAPADVVVVYEEQGKPRVRAADSTDEGWLRFNLAHTGAVIVFAVAREREVGVDVEMVRDVDVEAIAQRSFSARQYAELMRLTDSARAEAFFVMWARNEAFFKGLGTGFDGADHDVDRTPGWSVTAFDAGPGCAAAVAVAGVGVRVPEKAKELTLPRARRGA